MKSSQGLFYLLAGDAFLIEEKLKSLVSQLQKKNKGEQAAFTFYLSDSSLETVLASARTLPFLAESQIFVLKNAEVLKKKDLEPLSQYFENPSPHTTMIFIAADAGKDFPLSELIASYGEVFRPQAKDKRAAAEKAVQEKLRSAGKSLTPPALSRLMEWAGDSPAFLDSILNQVILYNEKAVIDEETLQKFEDNRKEVDVFKLSNALIQKDFSKALQTYHAWLREASGEVPELVGLMHWQLRRFWKAKSLMTGGASAAEITEACKLSPKQAPFFMNQLKGVSLARLEKAIEGLFQLDWKIKTGESDAVLGFEKWLMETVI